MFKKIIYALIFFNFLPTFAFSQVEPDVKGFNQAVFEYNFSRADREIHSESWLSQARWGIESAISAWELISNELYDNPLLFFEDKSKIQKWSEEELEKRYINWLNNRFFGFVIEDAITSLTANTSDSHRFYTYYLDSDKNIIYDEINNDPSIIRPGEEDHNFLIDLEKWHTDALQYIELEINETHTRLIELYPELLAYQLISNSTDYNSVLSSSIEYLNNAAKTEFENLVTREQRIFTDRRTGDLLSLRKKSEEEAAQKIILNIIEETETFCNNGINELNNRIEAASAGTGDFAIMGEDWLELYKQQFEYGLKKWEEAEERFFIRRLEWEQESFKIFSEGQDAWLNAYKLFEEERNKWELKIKELFDSGEALFSKVSENFEKAINEAKIEFEYNLKLRTEAGTAKLKSLIDMYLISASGVSVTIENIQILLKQYGLTELFDITSAEFDKWLNDEIQILESYNEDTYFYYNYLNSLTEAKKLLNSYTIYKDRAQDTRNRIISEYSILFDNGLLIDILSDDYNTEDFFLDEYQIALIKAKSVVVYWEQQTEIAKAVSEYAEEIHSGRMTEAEGIKGWETAKTAYEEAIFLYESELSKLHSLNYDIIEQQKILNKLAQDIEEIEEVINKLNLEYLSLLSSNIENRDSFLIKEFESKYSELLNNYNELNKSNTDMKYINSIIDICVSENVNTAIQFYNLFISGNDEDLPSVEFLIEEINKIPTFTDISQVPSDISEFGFSQGNFKYDAINYLINEKNRLMALAVQNSEDAYVIENRFNTLISLLCNAYKAEAETNLKIRYAALSLFSDSAGPENLLKNNYTAIDWYLDIKNPELFDIETVTDINLMEILITDIEKSNIKLLEKKLELEISALEYLLYGKMSINSDSILLSQFCIYDTAVIQDGLGELLYLYNEIKENKNFSIYNDEFNDTIQWFISGGSFFIGTDAFLISENEEYYFNKSIYDLYSNFYTISIFGIHTISEQMAFGLNNLFSNYNIAISNDILPGITEICEALLNFSGDFIINTSQFLFEFDQVTALLPDLIKDELNNWKKILIENISLMAISGERTSLINLSDLNLEIENIDMRYKEFENIYEAITIYDENTIKYLNKLYWEILNDEIILSFKISIANYYYEYLSENEKTVLEMKKHWRQFLDNNLLNLDLEFINKSSWLECKLIDINNMVLIYSNLVSKLLDSYTLNNWNIENSDLNILNETYNTEYNKFQLLIYKNYSFNYELTNIGNALNFLFMDPEKYDLEKIRLEFLINEQSDLFENLRNNYLFASQEFYISGVNYDIQYNTVKEYFNGMEILRFNFEKQDAIRRWASSAYLDMDLYNTANCIENLDRANIILSVLSDLYRDEKNRPYDNPLYLQLYNEYEQSFQRLLRIKKTINLLNSEIAEEQIKNNNLYDLFISSLSQFGNAPIIDRNYQYPEDPAEWTIRDIVTLNNGLLSFSKDSTGKIVVPDNENINLLYDYYNGNSINIEFHSISQFEQELFELSKRMNEYFIDTENFLTWGLARNYLLRSLRSNNADISLLSENLYNASQLRNDHTLGNLKFIISPLSPKETIKDFISGYQPTLREIEKNAWDSLTDSEKEDLEFYLILTMSSNFEDYYYSFSQYAALFEYQITYNRVRGLYNFGNRQSTKYYNPLFFIYYEMRDVNKTISDRIKIQLDNTKQLTVLYETELLSNISNILKYKNDYDNSCYLLQSMIGAAQIDQNITWDDIENSLTQTGKFSNNEIIGLKNDWYEMLDETDQIFNNTIEALMKLNYWVENKGNDYKADLHSQFINDYQNQQSAMSTYFNTVESYMLNYSTIFQVEQSMIGAFGNQASSLRLHFKNLENVLFNNFIYIDNKNQISDFYLIENDFIDLYTQIINGKYNLEFLSRQTEWEIQQLNFQNKYAEWQLTIDSAMEKGRSDWKNGLVKIEDSYNRWMQKFQNEYNQINDAWTDAYLEGLLDKEIWLSQIESAAYNASSETLLQILGEEAERMSRIIDTREPINSLNDSSLPEAQMIIEDLLKTPGISNISNYFNIINDSSVLSNAYLRQGYGNGIWDTNIIKATAKEVARETNTQLASLETQKLIHKIYDSVEEAMYGVSSKVSSNNSAFRKSMDNLFVVEGNWKKNGNNYIKDIIVGSTVFEPVMIETHRVSGYTDYQIEPIVLKNDIGNYNLAILDSYAIMNIIDNLFMEINLIVEDIFGVNKEKTTIKSSFEKVELIFNYESISQKESAEFNSDNKLIHYFERQTIIVDYQDRYQNPGKFGAYIGYEPAVKPIGNKINSRKELFYDQGDGELGRLLSDYYYWSIIDGYGTSEMSIASWEKPLWNDKDSIFEAPSIRSTIEIANAIGVAVISAAIAPYTGGTSVFGFMALMAAINTTDDLIFSGLDYFHGYKTIDEALFDLGKASVINLGSSFASGAFNGLAGVAGDGFFVSGNGLTSAAMRTTTDPLAKVIIGTSMTGVQTFTTGLFTSAINGITYDHINGWSYSQDTFTEGIRGSAINSITSMTSYFTSGILRNSNSGINFEKLTGFNHINKLNVDKLNNFIGSLTGQGMQYALDGSLSLNLLNTSLFTNGKINVGLLEFNMNSDNDKLFKFGTGGANFSPDNIWSAIQGAYIWNLNNKIENYTENNDFKEKITLRAQYGYGDKQMTNQLFNIIKGIDELMVVADSEYDALTSIINGKRTIHINNYISGMNYEDQLRLAITLGHEAYRDGIITDDNYLESRMAVNAHTFMAAKMLNDGYLFTLDYNILADLSSYFDLANNSDLFNNYVDAFYDSSNDYWKLTKEGSLEYDGFATLRDEEGNVILSYYKMGLKSDAAIESALLYLLNVNQNDKEKVNAVRQMMENSGLVHTSDANPENWYWSGSEDLFDITNANMGRQINLNDIINFYNDSGAAPDEIKKSINRIYSNPVNFIITADTGLNYNIANTVLDYTYSSLETMMILANVEYLYNSRTDGNNIEKMIDGNANRTSEFDTFYKISLAGSGVSDASYLWHFHTGIDLSSENAIDVYVPGGYWELTGTVDHRAFYQLYGSDLKMSIQHLNSGELKQLTINTIFGGENSKLASYPGSLYGSGSGHHIHVDMTMNLPFDGKYIRQFVNPETLKAGSRIEYGYIYWNSSMQVLGGFPKNYTRY